MVVICRDDPLGKAFQVDAFHRCQVTSLLKTQILDPEPEVIDLTIVKEHLSDDGYGSQQTLSPEDNEVHEEEAVKVEEVPEEKNTFDVDAYYKATPELLEVIKSVPGVKNDKEVFSYKELSGLLSSYIINNRQTLFNANAPMVVDCKGDLLEKAFDVESFHRSEVSDLLRSRLIKVDNKEPEEKFELSTSYRPSPGFRKVLELASGGKGKDIYTFKEVKNHDILYFLSRWSFLSPKFVIVAISRILRNSRNPIRTGLFEVRNIFIVKSRRFQVENYYIL